MANFNDIKNLAAEIQRYSITLQVMYSLQADPNEINFVLRKMMETIAELDNITSKQTEEDS